MTTMCIQAWILAYETLFFPSRDLCSSHLKHCNSFRVMKDPPSPNPFVSMQQWPGHVHLSVYVDTLCVVISHPNASHVFHGAVFAFGTTIEKKRGADNCSTLKQ